MAIRVEKHVHFGDVVRGATALSKDEYDRTPIQVSKVRWPDDPVTARHTYDEDEAIDRKAVEGPLLRAAREMVKEEKENNKSAPQEATKVVGLVEQAGEQDREFPGGLTPPPRKTRSELIARAETSSDGKSANLETSSIGECLEVLFTTGR